MNTRTNILKSNIERDIGRKNVDNYNYNNNKKKNNSSRAHLAYVGV